MRIGDWAQSPFKYHSDNNNLNFYKKYNKLSLINEKNGRNSITKGIK